METFRTEIPNQFSLPRRISRLGELAYNLWWTWNPDAQRLFSRVDGLLWEQTYHNPVRFLRQVERARLNAVTNNRYYLEFYDRQFQAFDEYMHPESTWFDRNYPDLRNRPIVYFSMEFGLHETLPIYAGGLGVLSGDHVKEASDLGLPFVAIGFFYTEGYFTQRITEDGWQEAFYTRHPFEDLPVLPVVVEDGKPVRSMLAGFHCISWTPMWMAIHRRTGRSPLGSTAAIPSCVCLRRCCWGLAE